MDQEWLEELFTEKIKEFGSHERFMIRIHSLFFINKLASAVSKSVLNKQLVPVVLTLAEDPVPNIRFNVCKTIDSVYSLLMPGNKIKCEGALEKMVSDKDFDVHFFANIAKQKVSKF
jgi:serine/threonine-protein phosphatase 2A regulatory subunit A